MQSTGLPESCPTMVPAAEGIMTPKPKRDQIWRLEMSNPDLNKHPCLQTRLLDPAAQTHLAVVTCISQRVAAPEDQRFI